MKKKIVVESIIIAMLVLIAALLWFIPKSNEKNELPEPIVSAVEYQETTHECAPVEYPALIMVSGDLYYDSAEISTEVRCGMMDGTIDSKCEGDIPANDNQSNFGTGYGYQFAPDGIEVLIDDEWHIFKPFIESEWDFLFMQ